jgi:hypothetical protein
MNISDRLWLMMKMFRENYDNELYRQERILIGARPRPLSSEEKQLCQAEAKKVVCEVGISMYQFGRRMETRYNRTIETDAIHQAVELGVEKQLVQWSRARRYDSEKGPMGRNIVLTEKGYETIFEKGIELVMTIAHSLYIPKPER